jgi:hypothetical protein
MKHSLKKQFTTELKSIFSGYPKFIFSPNNHSFFEGIPVFVYHSIDPVLFENHLLYLKNNGFKTLNIYEFFNVIQKKKDSFNRKSILLTIDDCRSSVWRYAYPLLKKHNMNAVVFIIPGWTGENKARKNLFDVFDGKSNFEEIDKIDPYDRTLCTWQEISEMYNSSLINIESHTLFHREVFKSTKIFDFLTEDKSYLPYNFSASAYLNILDVDREIKKEDYLGLPLFETSPLMLAGPKISISEEFMALCKKIYNRNNSQGSKWQNEIKNLVSDSPKVKHYFNSQSDSLNDVYEDLKKAKELIQKRLDVNAGNHLCLPWTIGNSITIGIAKELGIKSCFWGVLKNKRINKPGDNPYFISRVKNDFISRLPGKNRKSLFSIYGYKLKRRLSNEKVF